ncbi:DUF3857 domain-containing protein [Pedobacter sp. MW01-1-1]|uniref:DUF3857 domain-containing protein n=1 Tax=Pedobacter sp. MW01-1-1 TaxID=3383027 RepID=UPI003FEFB6C8
MKLTLLFLSLFFSYTLLFAQDIYDVAAIPSNLRARANSCIRNEERTLIMQAADNVTLRVKKAITVFNENGEDEARWVMYYDKNISIKSFKGEVYNEMGKSVQKFSQNNLIDESAADGFSLFSDGRIKHYLPAVNQYPYTVVYTYEVKFKQNLVVPDWDPQPASDVSVEKSTYAFLYNPTQQVRIKAQGYTGNPEESTEDKLKKLTWTVSNVAAVKPEPYSPNRDSYQTSIKISPLEFTYFGHSGKYTNWDELGKWVYEDLLKNRGTLPQTTINTVKDLIKDETNDKDKARKIYDYLQKKTRYISVQVGIGGFQPFEASEVDRLGYGDCKALVNYMQSLLKVADIESYYCVVQAGREKISLEPDFATMQQGNHIILCMPLKGDTTWLECTSQKIPFGYLGDFTDDRLVLACTAEGGKVLRTPKLETVNNTQVRKADLIISPVGNIKATISTNFYGAQYENREQVIYASPTEQPKVLKDYYNIDNIEFESIKYKQNKTINPEVNEQLVVNMPNYAPLSNNKMFLELNAFNLRRSIPELKSRQLPVVIDRGFIDEDTLTYTLPDNIDTGLIEPANKSFKSEFGEYLAKVHLDGKKLVYYRRLKINDGNFPPDKYAEFSKFMNEVNSADYIKIALTVKK